MPVIVDEIVISVEVTNQEAAAPAGGGGGASPTDDRQAVVSECVERVLDILRQKQER
jgi:Family of unknown function (DUF5908)